jgi:hypothetical protein
MRNEALKRRTKKKKKHETKSLVVLFETAAIASKLAKILSIIMEMSISL